MDVHAKMRAAGSSAGRFLPLDRTRSPEPRQLQAAPWSLAAGTARVTDSQEPSPLLISLQSAVDRHPGSPGVPRAAGVHAESPHVPVIFSKK